MSQEHKEMMELYKQLSLNDKRNEFSSLLEKMNQILTGLLAGERLTPLADIKNYDTNSDSSLTEDEIFTFFYEDLWNIKNRLLALLILKSENK